ncbi:hypothetical protein CspHIS471_0202460 [Cutaneotrichosporon sp. HIS471]|nr:hypothetical protein CspHIS471_0202460 [Cutaneotrichosporon sp. HIS471]
MTRPNSRRSKRNSRPNSPTASRPGSPVASPAPTASRASTPASPVFMNRPGSGLTTSTINSPSPLTNMSSRSASPVKDSENTKDDENTNPINLHLQATLTAALASMGMSSNAELVQTALDGGNMYDEFTRLFDAGITQLSDAAPGEEGAAELEVASEELYGAYKVHCDAFNSFDQDKAGVVQKLLVAREKESAGFMAMIKDKHAARLRDLTSKVRTLQENEMRLQMDVREWKQLCDKLRRA